MRIPPVLFQPIAADGRREGGWPGRGGSAAERHRRDRRDRSSSASTSSSDWRLSARHDPREVIADPHARYFGAELAERTLVPGADARLGEIRFEEWLGKSVPQAAHA